MSRVLAIATHPDDETLGCGGTLLRHKADGDTVYWLIATQMTLEGGFSPERIAAREVEISAVAAIYGFDEVMRLKFRAAGIDNYPMATLVEAISGVFEEFKPDTVYLPFRGDVHSDHRRVFEAAFSCTKSFRYPFVKRVLMMETLSETEAAPALADTAFIPNWFVNISPHMDEKVRIMECYQGETGEHPFPRSGRTMRALAAFRGATAGVEYAEAFMLLKAVE